MSRREELLEKLKSNPQKIRFEEVDKVLLFTGFMKGNREGEQAILLIL